MTQSLIQWPQVKDRFDYKDFCTPEEIAAFHMVKWRSMHLADCAREVCASLTNGTIGDGDRSDKEFVNTERGQYRIKICRTSDNSTEQVAHDQMGVTTIIAGERNSIMPWLWNHGVIIHGVTIEWPEFVALVGAELQKRDLSRIALGPHP